MTSLGIEASGSKRVFRPRSGESEAGMNGTLVFPKIHQLPISCLRAASIHLVDELPSVLEMLPTLLVASFHRFDRFLLLVQLDRIVLGIVLASGDFFRITGFRLPAIARCLAVRAVVGVGTERREGQ